MSKPMIRIHNLETDEIIDREMTDEEFFVYEEQRIIKEKSDKAQAAAKSALLERLGITEDEAKLLLGGN